MGASKSTFQLLLAVCFLYDLYLNSLSYECCFMHRKCPYGEKFETLKGQWSYRISSYSFRPWIVSTHFCTVTFGFQNLKKNSFSGNYMRNIYNWCQDLSFRRKLSPLHVVTFTLISNLATDYIQKRRGEPGLFSF